MGTPRTELVNAGQASPRVGGYTQPVGRKGVMEARWFLESTRWKGLARKPKLPLEPSQALTLYHPHSEPRPRAWAPILSSKGRTKWSLDEQEAQLRAQGSRQPCQGPGLAEFVLQSQFTLWGLGALRAEHRWSLAPPSGPLFFLGRPEPRGPYLFARHLDKVVCWFQGPRHSWSLSTVLRGGYFPLEPSGHC